ncbi:DUF4197 domain-containing protein [Alteripontixanthobacter maritimus]|nr:DUF4197 domain-containing protein [Alteripontixanthobacter maritimus]
MTEFTNTSNADPILITSSVGRRGFLGGIIATGALALPGCTSLGGLGGFTLTDAIREMLLLSSDRAFARLTADGGYWDDQVERVGLGRIMGTRGDVLSRILTSGLFKNQLQNAFADIAIEGAERAAPLVADTVRTIGFANAVDLVRGGPSAATSFLRGSMGRSLVEVMVPELGQAMRVARDPVLGQALGALTGVDVGSIAANFAGEIDNSIWNEMGREEALIRANPEATRNPAIIGVFGTAARF